jgi:ATP-binding protein involved in chromosome partitioning
MRIAIPITNGRLEQHFGHCEKFALIDIDREKKEIVSSLEVIAPEHKPGLLPPWLAERGVNIVIAGDMGARAQSLFEAADVEVLTGAPPDAAIELVNQYLAGTLVSVPTECNHHHH